MNKLLLTAFMFCMLITLASSVSAVALYEYWPDFTFEPGEFNVGEEVTFNYSALGPGTHLITTEIFLIYEDDYANPVAQLVDTSGYGGSYDSITFSTEDHESGDYTLYGVAHDTSTNTDATASLDYELMGEANTAPYFVNLPLFYNKDIALGSDTLVNLSNYAHDDENDDLEYFIVGPANPDVATCTIQSGSEVFCTFNSVGTTTFIVAAFDGDLYSLPWELELNVFEVIPNIPPNFGNMQLAYSYDIALEEVDVVDLAAFGDDPDGNNADLTYGIDTSNTNVNVVDCDLVGTTLHCDLLGVGNTTLAVSVSDDEDTTWATIEIEVYEVIVPNNPPYFENLNLFYSYVGAPQVVDVVNLSEHGIDPENDPLTYDVDLDNTNTSVVSMCAIIDNEILRCALSGYGQTTVDVSVADPFNPDVWATITIEVLEEENEAPYFQDLQDYYSYNIDLGSVEVVDLEDYVVDPNNDELFFDLDDSQTNLSVVSCELISNGGNNNIVEPPQGDSLAGNIFSAVKTFLGFSEATPEQPVGTPVLLLGDSVLYCQLNNVGTTTVDVSVSDDEFTTWATLTINVYEDVVNEPPYFENLQLYYSYDIDEGSVEVVDLAEFAFDPDDDDLFFGLDESQTNLDVVDCTLINNKDEDTSIKTKLNNLIDAIFGSSSVDADITSNDGKAIFMEKGMSVLYCDLNGVGTTTVDVAVTDTNYVVWATLTIHVYENGTTNTAPYFKNLQTHYEYDIELLNTDVVDLAQFAHDDENDELFFSLDDSMTDPDIVVCDLIEANNDVDTIDAKGKGLSLINCDLNGVGTTYLDAVVSDGEFDTYATLVISVYDDSNPNNTAPYFDDTLVLEYEYNIALGEVDVVNLAPYAHDDEYDVVSFFLDQTSTNQNIVSCDLLEAPAPSKNPYEGPSLIHCDLNGVGTTYFDAYVTDGELNSSVTFKITVYEETTNTPPYFVNLQTHYEYDIDLGIVQVVNLANFAFDDENDELFFDLDDSMTNSDIISCSLVDLQGVIAENNEPLADNLGGEDSIVQCTLNGVGTTYLDAVVSDGEFDTYATLVISVYDDSNPNNTAPYFDNLLPLYYEYDIDLGQVDVVNLAPYAHDDEYDVVSFFLDQTSTNQNIVSCDLVEEATGSKNPYQGPSLIHCDLNGLGTTTMVATVTDGDLSSSVLLTIHVYDDVVTLGPVAIISSPPASGVMQGEMITLDGSNSYSPSQLELVSYDWTISTLSGGEITSTSGAVVPYVFTETGLYYVNLVVTDKLGQTGFASRLIKVYRAQEEEDPSDPESGLKIRSFDIYGFDYERAYIGDDVIITAEVENQAGQDLDNVRMTFTIPEFGVRFKSHAVDIDAGDREYFTIHAYVPYFIEPGVYYPMLSFTDGDIRRVKPAYLEVYE